DLEREAGRPAVIAVLDLELDERVGVERYRLGAQLLDAGRPGGAIDQHALGVADLDRQPDRSLRARVERVRRLRARHGEAAPANAETLGRNPFAGAGADPRERQLGIRADQGRFAAQLGVGEVRPGDAAADQGEEVADQRLPWAAPRPQHRLEQTCGAGAG